MGSGTWELGERSLVHGPCVLFKFTRAALGPPCCRALWPSSKPLRPTGPRTPPLRVAMQRVSQLALRRLLSPPSATAAARRAAPVAAEAVSGGGGVLLPRGGVAGVHLESPLRFLGVLVHPCRTLSSYDACDFALGSGERMEWQRLGAPVGSKALHLRRER
jgi:hypothetical protein